MQKATFWRSQRETIWDNLDDWLELKA